MEDGAALYAEIRRLRRLARGVTDDKALAAIRELIQELKLRAGERENGGDGEYPG
jgi:hypothetical protein